MFEDAVNAAYAINSEGSILASVQAADALPAGTGVQPKPITAFLQAAAEQQSMDPAGHLRERGLRRRRIQLLQLLTPYQRRAGARR